MGQGSCKGFTGCGDVGAGHGGGVTIHTVAKGTGGSTGGQKHGWGLQLWKNFRIVAICISINLL